MFLLVEVRRTYGYLWHPLKKGKKTPTPIDGKKINQILQTGNHKSRAKVISPA